MPVTLEQQNEARARARGIVDDVRAQMPALEIYSDRQVWQAILDARSAWKDLVGLVFLHHIMSGTTPPECPYELEDPEATG